MAPKESAKEPVVRRRKIKRDGLGVFLYRILKSVDSNSTISRKGMHCLNNMMADLTVRIGQQAGELVFINKKATIQVGEIRSATKLLVHGPLGVNAVNDGNKALSRYNASKGTKEKSSAKSKKRSKKPEAASGTKSGAPKEAKKK